MRPRLMCLVPAVVASLALAACGSSSSGTGSSSRATIGGMVITNAQGMTLYSLSAEHGGKFLCTSTSCTQVWHPLSGAAGTPSGVGSLGTVARPDGTQQVTYKGMPLYTFAQDQRPGDAKGQGFKDVGTWSAVTVGAAAAPAAPSTSTQTSGRYGY
jgi:predicted lipoprotein with Yx(FWY)xxD motif